MNELNELIEHLYKEGIQEGRLPQQAASPNMVDSSAKEADSRVSRLQRVLAEMASHLQSEDQPNLTLEAPNTEACLRILNHWEQMMQSAEGLRLHMLSLEQDIEKMQPWGDFDVMKVEQLENQGCHLRFWQLPVSLFAIKVAEGWWKDCHMQVISQNQEWSHYVTVTVGDTTCQQPAEAQAVEICPCPISTLIMLQTRDKDSLKKLEAFMGDYALVHYGEVYNALRSALPEGAMLPQLITGQRGLRQRLKNLFSKNKSK